MNKVKCFLLGHRWTMLPFHSVVFHKIGCSRCGIYENNDIFEYDGKGTYNRVGNIE